VFNYKDKYVGKNDVNVGSIVMEARNHKISQSWERRVVYQ